MPIEHTMADPHTYTVLINERQRKMLHRAVQVLIEEENGGGDPQYDEDDYDVLVSLEDMLNATGSTGPLAPSPCVNSFVL